MFKTAVISAAMMFLLTACGIPEEQHQATLDELKELKAEMAANTKSCDEAKAELEKKNQTLTDENGAMKAKLISLGQNLSSLKTQTGAMIQDISQKEKQIAELLKAQEAARKRAKMFKDLVGKFQQMIDSGKLQVEIRKGKMIVKMSDKILFAPGRDRLKKDGAMAMEQVTQILAGIGGRSFQVAGHTDNVPIKSRRFKSNWELSASRAVNVVKFMVEKGMDPNRVSAAGYGQFDPVGDNNTPEGRAINRRIEITLMPSIEELPKIGQ